jgi:cytochrome P450
MSATTRQSATATAPQTRPSSPSQPRLPAASVPESLAILTTAILPALVRGLFSPRKRAMKLLTAINADRRAIAMLRSVRRKHNGEGVRLLDGRIAVLWGDQAIREVLDNSATLYASDSGAKAKGMCHFQPDALTLSRGEEWRDRRAFNESVLASRERIHPFASRFLAVVEEECQWLQPGATLRYEDWERLFDRIALRVIFGDQAREDQALTELLEQLMKESNRLVGLKRSDTYYELYAQLEHRVSEPGRESLVGLFDAAPHTDRTRVVHQIPHWVFAMRDTLGANAFRALAAIVADPDMEARVRRELEGKDLSDPAAVDGFHDLGGCLHEAMRLWPTTPLLARETTGKSPLGLQEGTQVMLLNVFNHRLVSDGSRVRPERWPDAWDDYRLNHLSHGTQDCPGAPLVMLLGKAVLARILNAHKLALQRPELPADGDMPEMLDFFAIEFSVKPA